MNDFLESFLLIFGQNKYIAKPMKIFKKNFTVLCTKSISNKSYKEDSFTTYKKHLNVIIV